MRITAKNCAKDNRVVYLHWTEGLETFDKFPCLCLGIHELHPAFLGTVDRVSLHGTNAPSDGEVKFCRNGHVMMLNNQSEGAAGIGVGIGGTLPSGTFVRAWRCTNLDCDERESA
jgi:hypothetical protein